jgi:hypothetical protein
VLARGDALLAHGAVIPGLCQWNGGQLHTAHVIDWVARPGAIGAGGTLMKQLSRLADAMLTIGGSDDTRAILPRIGFRSAGTATSLVRSLRPLRRAFMPQPVTWRLPARLARAFYWFATAPRHNATGWTCSAVDADGVGTVEIPECRDLDRAAVMIRTVSDLRHASDCPTAHTRAYTVAGPTGQPTGFFVLARVRGQARLADIALNSDDDHHWQALIQLAIDRACEDATATEIAVLSSDPSVVRHLQRNGFHVRGSQPILLMTPAVRAPPKDPIVVSMLDNDAYCRPAAQVEFLA